MENLFWWLLGAGRAHHGQLGTEQDPAGDTQELAPGWHHGQGEVTAVCSQKLGQLYGDARTQPWDGFGMGLPHSDPKPCPGWHRGRARAGADLPGTEGMWRGAFPVPGGRCLSELCNAARTARLLCVNPINISWSCFLQGKGCSQLRLSAAPTSREQLISFHQHPAHCPHPPHSTLANIPVPSRGSGS